MSDIKDDPEQQGITVEVEDNYNEDFVSKELAKQKAQYEREVERTTRLIQMSKEQKIKIQTAAEVAKEERDKLKTEKCIKCEIEKSCLPYQSICDTCIAMMSYNSHLDRYTDV